MTSPKRLLAMATSIVLVMVANGLMGLMQWLILVLIARHSSPELVGQYALATSLVMPVFLFSNLGLRPLLISAASCNSEDAQKYVSARIYATGAALTLIAVLSPLVGGLSVSPLMVLLIAVARAAEAIIDITTGLHHKVHVFDRPSWYAIVRIALGMLAFTLTLPLAGLEAALTIYSITLVSCFLFLDRPSTHRLYDLSSAALLPPTRATLAAMAELLWRSAPLGLAAGVISLLQAVPRSLLTTTAGLAAAGHYSATAQLVQIGVIVSVSIGQYIAPRLSAAHHSGKHQTFWTLIHLGSAPFLIGALFVLPIIQVWGATVMKLIYGENFTFSTSDLMLMVVGGLFGCLCTIVGVALTASGIHRQQIAMVIGQLAICILANSICITRFENALTGASVAFLITNALTYLVMVALLVTARKTEAEISTHP